MITTSDNLIVAEPSGATPPPAVPALPAWPKDARVELDKFYGKHDIGADGEPTERWQNSFLQTIQLPYPMRLSWDPEVIVHKLRCHVSVVRSLYFILGEIQRLYGTREKIRAAGMDLLGGCYCYRRARGSSRMSVHAWGAAIDLDPERNPLGRKWQKDKGMMPLEVVEIFESQGWTWGGRWKLQDCMHFQAANT